MQISTFKALFITNQRSRYEHAITLHGIIEN